MLARYKRFFHASDADMMGTPMDRFLVYYKRIPVLEAEEEIRGLLTYHHSKPGDRVEELANIIKYRGNPPAKRQLTESFLNKPGDAARWEATAGSIAQERERQIAAQADLARKKQEWLEQRAQQQPPQP